MREIKRQPGNAAPNYSVLFVCTANRCRSPMAEAIWRQQVAQRNELSEWRIGSAGTWTQEGYPAMPLTQAVLAEMGLDVQEHRSRLTERELLAAYSLILVMQRNHQEALVAEFPEFADRLYLLTEMADLGYGIHDPVAGTIDDYRHTAEEICSLLERGAGKIRQLAQAEMEGEGGSG